MKKLIFILISFLSCVKLYAQSVTIDPNPLTNGSGIINAKAMNAGTIIPNMTSTQRTAIATPQKGLLVFDTNTNTFWFNNGTAWVELVSSTATSNWTPFNSNTELSSNNYSRFYLGNGTNTVALNSSGIGNDGTLNIRSPQLFISKYLTLDGNSIQARTSNNFGEKAENNLFLNRFGGNVGIGTLTPTEKLHVSGHITSSSISSTSSKSTHAQGAYLEWNKDGSTGKTYLLNQKGLGVGGFVYAEVDNANVVSEKLRVESTGGVYSAQTNGLNIVPIGIMEYNVHESNNGLTSGGTYTNLAGNLIVEASYGSAPAIDDWLSGSFKIDPIVVAQYSKIIAIGSPNYSEGFTPIPFGALSSPSGFIGEIISGVVKVTTGLNQGTFYRATITVDDFPFTAQTNLWGTVIFYGIK